jgi:dihydrofolate synthase/folylpolyglutamate synthase
VSASRQEQSRPIGTAEDAGAWLEGLINFERRPGFDYARLGLEPIRRLLAALDHPERALSIVHVAGSKGKGSTCLLAEAVLLAAGERVGTFTSPHLERWTERFRIDGREVEGERLAAAVERVRPHVEAQRASHPDEPPTFFDATTAVALVLFAEAKVSRVLLEVGLGGRLDSTNAVVPEVTCITSIELEHTDKLGDSLAAIASEKAGIMKPGVPCVVGRLPGEAMEVVEKRGAELGAPLLRLGREFEVREGAPAKEGQQSIALRFSDGFEIEAVLPVIGTHQRDNAALAIAAIRSLNAHSNAALAEGASRGLARARLPGRLEVMERRPWVLVDAAHTLASALSLAAVIESLEARRVELLLSVSADKELAGILGVLLPLADRVWLTRADPIRSLDPAALAERVSALFPALDARVIEDPTEAATAARDGLESDAALVCAGSVYLAGVARRALMVRASR